MKPRYANSRALVIGINQYAMASPLSYAVSDAEGVREVLINDLNFSVDKVIYLAANPQRKPTY
jgi:uncharacterized caspase-like protein